MLNGTAKKRERNKNKLVALVTLDIKSVPNAFLSLTFPCPHYSMFLPALPSSRLSLHSLSSSWLLSHPPYFFAPPLPLLLSVSPNPTRPVWSLLSRTCS